MGGNNMYTESDRWEIMFNELEREFKDRESELIKIIKGLRREIKRMCKKCQ